MPLDARIRRAGSYVGALTRARRLEEARLTFEKMFTYANHLGLYSEEIGSTGEQLGNFPQAFSHLSLISAAVNLDYQLDHGPGSVDQALPPRLGGSRRRQRTDQRWPRPRPVPPACPGATSVTGRPALARAAAHRGQPHGAVPAGVARPGPGPPAGRKMAGPAPRQSHAA